MQECGVPDRSRLQRNAIRCLAGRDGRPPLEASGTSEMKAVIHGGLHLTVLDGWWAEAYDGPTAGRWTARSTPTLGRRTRVTPLPRTTCSSKRSSRPSTTAMRKGSHAPWLARIRASMRTLAPGFCTRRMLDDYVERIYTPTTIGA